MSDRTRQSRRKILKTIAVGSGIYSTTYVVPKNWSRPVVESVLLPAHAAGSPTSDCGQDQGLTYDLSEAFPAMNTPGDSYVNCEGQHVYDDLIIENTLGCTASLIVGKGGAQIDDALEIDGTLVPGSVCFVNNYPEGTVLKENIPPGGTVAVRHVDYIGVAKSAFGTLILYCPCVTVGP